jgi:hypothetical protein
MHIHRASELGTLHQHLGIGADSRISYQITAKGVLVWDLATEVQYDVDASTNPPGITKAKAPVPQIVKDTIAKSTDELKTRWQNTWEMNEERETIAGELRFRGINCLEL